VISVRNVLGAFSEFYEHALTPGVHFVQLDDVRMIPRTLMALRADDAMSQRMARRGTELMAKLNMDQVEEFRV
jgi:hypothetical protein